MNLWVTTSPRLASQPVIRLLSEWPHRPRRGARPTPWTRALGRVSTVTSEHLSSVVNRPGEQTRARCRIASRPIQSGLAL